jgi:hypothetical protein
VHSDPKKDIDTTSNDISQADEDKVMSSENSLKGPAVLTRDCGLAASEE